MPNTSLVRIQSRIGKQIVIQSLCLLESRLKLPREVFLYSSLFFDYLFLPLLELILNLLLGSLGVLLPLLSNMSLLFEYMKFDHKLRHLLVQYLCPKFKELQPFDFFC